MRNKFYAIIFAVILTAGATISQGAPVTGTLDINVTKSSDMLISVSVEPIVLEWDGATMDDIPFTIRIDSAPVSGPDQVSMQIYMGGG